jgi:hypothetical protein
MPVSYLCYRDREKVQPIVAQIAWSPNLVILQKCKDHVEREFCLTAKSKFGWTKNVLLHQIENQTCEKTLLNQTSFDRPVLEKTRQQAEPAVKDEYTSS